MRSPHNSTSIPNNLCDYVIQGVLKHHGPSALILTGIHEQCILFPAGSALCIKESARGGEVKETTSETNCLLRLLLSISSPTEETKVGELPVHSRPSTMARQMSQIFGGHPSHMLERQPENSRGLYSQGIHVFSRLLVANEHFFS